MDMNGEKWKLIVTIILATILSGCEDPRFEQADANGNHVTETQNDKIGNIWTIHLSPVEVTYKGVGATADELKVLKKEFPDWTFKNGNSLPGNVKVIHYDAFIYPPETPADSANGWNCTDGDCFELIYNGTKDASSLRWLQIVCTDYPNPRGMACPPEGSAYVDPAGKFDDNLPFYYTEDEQSHFSDSINLTFIDSSFRPLVNNVNWRARLYLVEWDGKKNVIIHDGVEWGFKLRKGKCGNPSTYEIAGVARDKWTTEDIYDYVPTNETCTETYIHTPPLIPRYPPGCFECHSYGNYSIRGESMSKMTRIILVGIIIVVSIFAIRRKRL